MIKVVTLYTDCIYPQLIKQQSNLLNGVGFGVINNIQLHPVYIQTPIVR